MVTFYDSKVVKDSYPSGEYLEWTIRDGGVDKMVATYVTLAEERTGDFGQLPVGEVSLPWR